MNVVRKLSWILAPFVLAGTMMGAWAVADMREKREVDSIAGKMKTVCVGRFLTDMPEDAQVELSKARIDGFDISAFKETGEEFQTRATEREKQITAEPDWRGGEKNLESANTVTTSSGLVGKIFMHGRIVDEGTRVCRCLK